MNASPAAAVSKSARVTLRQICGLGLPAPVLLPSLLAALREIVPAAHAAFFYCDEAGNIVNLYAERMLPPEAMARYHERHFRADVGAFASAYLKRVAAKSPVSSHAVTRAERGTDYYRDVLARIGIGHMLYGIVRHDQRVIGQLSMYREAGEAAFTPRDERALEEVLHYLGRALAPPAEGRGPSPGALPAEEAMAVLAPDGSVRYADADWLRLVRMARGEPIAPGQARDEGAALALFVKNLLAKAASSAHVVESAWGRFSFRHHDLQAADGGRMAGLVVSRLATEPVRLAEGAASLGLTAQQREVALLLAEGNSNAAVAERLGVSINTANYHVKRLFARLGAHERQQVAGILLAAAGNPRELGPAASRTAQPARRRPSPRA